MRIAGVIVEYNPFHNGHLYHLQKTKKQTAADLTIAVMSGNFLQRGEPALLSKWTRTKLALKAGIDLVVELPYAYATQKAEVFAFGAVALLDMLGTTDLCFGSEKGSIAPFLLTLSALEENKDAFQQELKKHLASGVSYPRAMNLAFQSLGLSQKEYIDLSQPNNILGFHYIEAVKRLNSGIQVDTIKRQKAGYNQTTIADQHIASATAIRKAIFGNKNSLKELKNLVPPYTYEAITNASDKNHLRRWEDYFPYLKYRLLTTAASEIAHIYEAEEGLENRLKKQIRTSNNFKEWMEGIKTKRYTWTRLQRLSTHVLTGTTKDEMRSSCQLERPKYIRLLGMNQNGQHYLNQIKKQLSAPIISRVGREQEDLLALDIRASDCYRLIKPLSDPSEFEQAPIRYDLEKEAFMD
ncbi:MAG: nucleotidyltransferase [Tuberibacillus sp.]